MKRQYHNRFKETKQNDHIYNCKNGIIRFVYDQDDQTLILANIKDKEENKEFELEKHRYYYNLRVASSNNHTIDIESEEFKKLFAEKGTMKCLRKKDRITFSSAYFLTHMTHSKGYKGEKYDRDSYEVEIEFKSDKIKELEDDDEAMDRVINDYLESIYDLMDSIKDSLFE